MKLPLIILGALAAVLVHAQDALPGQTANALPTNANLPTLWIIGDSTVRNGSGYGGATGQWGWGAPIVYEFDLAKINVVNRALGGTSSRTFYASNWPSVVANVKKGDFVIMQFGHNDNNGVFTGAGGYRASLNGIGDETQVVDNARSGQKETVHTFGWYMKQFVQETAAKGATPIICSLIPRKIWADGKIVRKNQDYFPYGDWAGQVAMAEKVAFVDLNEITARKYDALGEAKVAPLFVPMPTEHTHTDWYGAIINAESVISGLKALKDNPLAVYFSAAAKALPTADAAVAPLVGTSTEQSAVAAAAARATTPAATPSTPTVTATAAPTPTGRPTLYVVGDSTANSGAPILGWGTPFIDYFDKSKVTVLNKARGGRSSRSYMHEGLWAAIVKDLQPGDLVVLQFGHNDGGKPNVNRAGDRPSLPGLGEETQDAPTPPGTQLVFGAAANNTAEPDPAAGPMETIHTFGWYMRQYVTDARAKGATIFILTLTDKNNWEGEVNARANIYSDWSKEVAQSQNVPMVDLTNMAADQYDQLGREKVKALFSTTDTTHSSPAGADFNASLIVSGLKALKNSPFTALLSDKGKAVPAADAKYIADNLPAEKSATATASAK
jgi:lysophospholipase L1-like esterase